MLSRQRQQMSDSGIQAMMPVITTLQHGVISDMMGRNGCWRRAQETPSSEEVACKMGLEKEA